MADNVTIPATGTGDATPVIATDDVSGVQYQRVKLDGGGDGATTPILAGHGTAASALRVELPTDGTGVVGLAAGSQVIGHVIADTGSTTAVTGNVTVIQGTATSLKAQAEAYQGGSAVGTGNPLQVSLANTGANATAVKVDGSAATQPISGTVTVAQATASSLNATVVGTGTFATQATLQTQTDTVMVGGVNIKEINAVTPLMGNGVTGTGSQRVTVASDNTPFAVKIDQTTPGTTNLVALAANQSVNAAQINGHTAVEAGVNGTLAVGGNVATNVAIGTNPVNLGAQAVSAENTAVTATRMAQLVTDLVGKLIVLPYANPENFVSGAITSAMTGTTSTSLIGAPASGLRNYITQITVSNAHATVGTDIIIQDGSGGTTLYTIPAPAVYGGATLTFPVALRQPTTATAIYCANVTTGASTKVSASGYKGA